jgi:hypothetical protein
LIGSKNIEIFDKISKYRLLAAIASVVLHRAGRDPSGVWVTKRAVMGHSLLRLDPVCFFRACREAGFDLGLFEPHTTKHLIPK